MRQTPNAQTLTEGPRGSKYGICGNTYGGIFYYALPALPISQAQLNRKHIPIPLLFSALSVATKWPPKYPLGGFGLYLFPARRMPDPPTRISKSGEVVFSLNLIRALFRRASVPGEVLFVFAYSARGISGTSAMAKASLFFRVSNLFQ